LSVAVLVERDTRFRSVRRFDRWEQLALTTPYWNRFGCNYIRPRSAGCVVIRTTGPDTFKIGPSRLRSSRR
jgi:hypothetical protein